MGEGKRRDWDRRVRLADAREEYRMLARIEDVLTRAAWMPMRIGGRCDVPKFIGNDLKCAEVLADNCIASGEWVRVTYAQAAKLDAADRAKSLDTTDKGGPRSYAKRWFRWFGKREAVRALGTASAIRRAGVVS